MDNEILSIFFYFSLENVKKKRSNQFGYFYNTKIKEIIYLYFGNGQMKK